jgi:hypothetical protein
LLRGGFQGKNQITVRVTEKEGEKVLAFDSVAKGPGQPELVGAAGGGEAKAG